MDGNAPITNSFCDLPVAATRVWPGNPRKKVGDLVDLAASVREVGIVEPLVVRPLREPEGDVTHEVIAGQRRFLAASAVGLSTVPCRVVHLDDAAALELALVENSQRADCDPIDEAESIRRLMNDHGYELARVAARLGREERWVRRRLSLLDLCEEAKAAVRSDRLPLGHAIALAAVDAETQATVLLRFTNREIPSIKSFAREIIYALHLISAAPFDAADKTLPGGACGGCPKRSDAQGQLDIFGESSPTEGAHCLDVTCWERKGEETWSRAKESARKRHLTIIEDGSEVIAHDYGTPVVRADKPYTIGAPTPRAKPVAITRTERGRVVELYVRPAAKTSEDDPEYRDPEEVDRDDEGDEGEDEDGDAVFEKRREERARARLARYEQIARLVRGAGMGVAARHALSVNIAEYGDIDVREAARALKIELPADCEPEDIPGHVAESDTVYLLVVALAGGSLFDDAGAAGSSPTERALREAMARGNVVGEVRAPPVIKVPVTEDPAALCARGRWTVVALYGAEWSLRRACEQRDEATPLLKGAAGDVQTRLYDPDGEMVSWWPDGPRPPAIVDRFGKGPAVPVTLYVRDDAWQALAPASQRVVQSPAAGVSVLNIRPAGAAHRELGPMTPEETEVLRAAARTVGLEVFDAPPAAGAKPEEPAPASAPQRVLIVHTEGDDWMGARKGLAAWQADKTPGAGFTTGGSAAPLAMLHTPAVDSADVAKLLARYQKAGRRVLDLGVVAGDKVFDCDPSNRAIRERWNVAHPHARVSVPDEPKPAKKASTKKGGR